MASCAIRGADPISDLAPRQKSQDLGENLLCLAGQLGGGGAGQGVGDKGKGIIRCTVSLGDGLSIGHEQIGTDGRGRNTTPL